MNCTLEWSPSFVNRSINTANKNYKWPWESEATEQTVQVRRLHKSFTHSWLLWGYFLPDLQITIQHMQHMEALWIGNADISSKSSSVTIKQSPADWCWLTVTCPRVMRRITAAPVTPTHSTFVMAKSLRINFDESRPWPAVWLDSFTKSTAKQLFEYHFYYVCVTIRFTEREITLLLPLKVSCGRLKWPRVTTGAEASIKTTRHETIDHSPKQEWR